MHGTPAPTDASKRAKRGDGQEEHADDADEADRGATSHDSPHPEPCPLALYSVSLPLSVPSFTVASLYRRAPSGKSGRRVSNPRPSAWEADALPTELRPRDPDETVLRGGEILPARPPPPSGLTRGASGNTRRGDLVTSHPANVAGVELEGVSETTLWTLYQRASEAAREDRVLHDPMAVDLIGAIDFPFEERFGASAGWAQWQALRARTFDREVRRFLHDHPDGTVVALGEGLETQFWRVNNGRLRWISVDLAPVIELRRRLLPSSPRQDLLASSVVDGAWLDELDRGAGVMVTAQGLLMYLEPGQVHELIDGVREPDRRRRAALRRRPALAQRADAARAARRADRLPASALDVGHRRRRGAADPRHGEHRGAAKAAPAARPRPLLRIRRAAPDQHSRPRRPVLLDHARPPVGRLGGLTSTLDWLPSLPGMARTGRGCSMSRRRSTVRGALIVVATVLAALGLTAGAGEAASAPGPCSLAGVSPPATYDHVVVIFEENASYGRVVGNADAPYFNQLAQQCALATNHHEVAGVSQPNYMAATGGQATGVGVKVNAPSIFSQAPSWLELQESMGSNCGGKSTFYKRGHDPALLVHAHRRAVQGQRHPRRRRRRRASRPSPPPSPPTRSSPRTCATTTTGSRDARSRTRARPICARWTRGSREPCRRSRAPPATRPDARSS